MSLDNNCERIGRTLDFYQPEINMVPKARVGFLASAEKQLRPASAFVSRSKKNLPEEISCE